MVNYQFYFATASLILLIALLARLQPRAKKLINRFLETPSERRNATMLLLNELFTCIQQDETFRLYSFGPIPAQQVKR